MEKDLKKNNLVKKIHSYYPAADVELIRKAYNFSANVHQGQKRLSGEPYLTHPLAVAKIIADLKLDVPSVVDGVTNLGRANFSTREQKQADNFREMLLAMGKDVRVILIKLADRVHNMRTLDHMPPDKQISIAQETLDIYAPFSHRLGIAWIKSELEDLG